MSFLSPHPTLSADSRHSVSKCPTCLAIMHLINNHNRETLKLDTLMKDPDFTTCVDLVNRKQLTLPPLKRNYIASVTSNALSQLADVACIERAKTVPSPRLVCVETNPGPTKKAKLIKLMNKRLAQFDARLAKKTAATAVVAFKAPKQRKRKINSSNKLSPVVTQYINTINDPFTHGPLRLGWGTMVPTNLYTAILRTSFTGNADGSFGVAMMPSLGGANNNIWFNNAGAGVATWNAQAYANGTNIYNMIKECRIVSGGVKVFPMVPGTAAPGVLYAGSLPALTVTDFGATTINTFAAVPYLKIGYGATGGCAVIHPIDPVSFEFTSIAGTGYQTGTLANSSSPIIVGLGFPASTVVFVEVVLNIEAINETSVTAVITNPELRSSDATNDLTDAFPSVENMWKTIKSYLPESSSVYEAATQLPSIARKANQAYGMYSRVKESYQGIRSDYFRNPTANTLTIEEIV